VVALEPGAKVTAATLSLRGIDRVNGAVLVLNQNYEPLNVCNLRRAIVLVFDGKAEVLEANGKVVKSASRSFPAPSVIRMVYLIHRPRPRVKLTRREVFIRDGYTCQYCGRQSHDLTIDHVVPRSRGGAHCWENLVSACKPCNHRKGGKLLGEARMHLRNEPREPRAGRYYTIERRIEGTVTQQWSKFLPDFTPVAARPNVDLSSSRAAR
jgi:5-methylcytosine-specific restriction endonuclease McrA